MAILATLFFPLAISAAEQPGRSEYLYALKLYEEKYYDLAAEQLERCLRDFPSLTEADEAQFMLGEAYLKSNEPDRARAAYLRTAIVYPQSPRAPEALFKVGESFQLSNHLQDAAQAYERVQGFYSGSAFAPLALQRAAALYAQIGNYPRSNEVASELIEKYPDSPAASLARLDKAETLAKQGDYLTARHYIRWVADRSGIDSLSARAWFQLGRFHRSRFELDAASEAFKHCFEKYSKSSYAANARLQLADLNNFRGITDLALETLAPLVTSSDYSIRIAAIEKLGDSYYHRRELNKAVAFYDSVSAYSFDAALKAAWSLELLGRKKEAFDRYLNLSVKNTPVAIDAKMRAAILAMELDRPESSANLWQDIIKNGYDVTDGDRILLEYARALTRARRSGVKSVVDTLINRWNTSPYIDDALFLSAEDALGYKDYVRASQLFKDLLNRYPASPLADTTKEILDFLHLLYLRGDNLIERMAELSSLPQNRTNPVRWALDWGDFYLDMFKDPIKAIDKFDHALDEASATPENRFYAIYRGAVAYLSLAEIARRESDSFSRLMYTDSAAYRLSTLNKLAPRDEGTRNLAAKLLLLEFTSADYSDSLALDNLIRKTETLFSRFDLEQTHPKVILYYLRALLSNRKIDDKSLPRFLDLAEKTISACKDKALCASLKLQIVIALETLGHEAATIDTLRSLVENYPQTPTTPVALEKLAGKKSLQARERFACLEKIRTQYPYYIDPKLFPLVEAELLDQLNRPLEALERREQADSAVVWGQPKLKSLESPSPVLRLERANAFRRAGEFIRASEELRIVLNLDARGEFAPAALLALADVERGRMNFRAALGILDSLANRFPKSIERVQAMSMKPELLIGTGNFREAQTVLNSLIQQTSNPDSLYHYSVLNVVCFHRLDRQDDARKSANDLFKQFKDRSDLDQARALFTLERGRSLERGKKWDEAREQYKIVREKYPLTEWSDDAAYSIGVSYLDQGRNDDAAKVLERMANDFPDSALAFDAYLMSGLAYYRAEKYSEAIASLRRVWDNRRAGRLWQPTFEALLSIYRELRFWDAALRLSRDYLDRFPDAPDVLDRRMDIAQFHLELRDYDESVRQYRPLLPLADSEREAEIQYYIGEAYFGKGEFRLAILEFLKVKVLGRKTKLDWGVTAIYQAGICYEKLQDWDGAARMYQRIIKEMGEDSNYGRAAKQKLDSLPRADSTPQTP